MPVSWVVTLQYNRLTAILQITGKKVNRMNEFLEQKILYNSLHDWIICLGIILLLIILFHFVEKLVIRKALAFSKKTRTTLDDFIISMLKRNGMPLLYMLSFYLGLKYISLPAQAEKFFNIAWVILIVFFVARTATSFTGYFFKSAAAHDTQDPRNEKQLKGIMLIGKIIIWIIAALFLLDHLGYNIKTLVAGLGIGGIAIALAAQTILGDLFSYLVIFFDKPFEIGDFIIIGDKMGTVEYIGIKTTRLRSLGGEQVICSNSDLTNSRIHNYKRMEERRILFRIGVVYDTPAAKLEKIPAMIRKILEDTGDIRFDRAHFQSFGDFSLIFEIVFYVLSSDYNDYMDKQHAINLTIIDRFEKEGIEFAYPTQTVFINNVKQGEPVTRMN